MKEAQKNPQNKRNRSFKQNKGHKKKNNTSPKHSNRLSFSFKKEDFACKISKKIRISLGLIGGLELLKTTCQAHIKILKGYEDPDALNKANFRKNYHCMGLAADIQVDSLNLKELFMKAKTIEEFKGIGINIDDNYIHVDSRKEDERLMWIEKGDQIIPITEDNYEAYFTPES